MSGEKKKRWQLQNPPLVKFALLGNKIDERMESINQNPKLKPGRFSEDDSIRAKICRIIWSAPREEGSRIGTLDRNIHKSINIWMRKWGIPNAKTSFLNIPHLNPNEPDTDPFIVPPKSALPMFFLTLEHEPKANSLISHSQCTI